MVARLALNSVSASNRFTASSLRSIFTPSSRGVVMLAISFAEASTFCVAFCNPDNPIPIESIML